MKNFILRFSAAIFVFVASRSVCFRPNAHRHFCDHKCPNRHGFGSEFGERNDCRSRRFDRSGRTKMSKFPPMRGLLTARVWLFIRDFLTLTRVSELPAAPTAPRGQGQTAPATQTSAVVKFKLSRRFAPEETAADAIKSGRSAV